VKHAAPAVWLKRMLDRFWAWWRVRRARKPAAQAVQPADV
jgi:hypothetical protein